VTAAMATRAPARLTTPSWSLVVALALRAHEAEAPAKRARVRLRLLDGGQAWPVRPVTRADCANVPRPCPFVSCKYNLYLEVQRLEGAALPRVRLTQPTRAPWQVPPAESCVLDLVGDVEDPKPLMQTEVARLLNLDTEWIRQIEVRGRARLRELDGVEELAENFADARDVEAFEDLEHQGALNDGVGEAHEDDAPVEDDAGHIEYWTAVVVWLVRRCNFTLEQAWRAANVLTEEPRRP
jgi:hypothetical protein